MRRHVAVVVKEDLDRLIGALIETGLCEDQNFPSIRQLGSNWEVTFSGAEHVSIGMGDTEYENVYRELAERRSYNMRLADGGLLQLMYRFDANHLLQHRLAFYPSPSLRPFPEEPDAYMYDELFIDIIRRHIVPFPLRFDFDDREEIHVDITHPKSHLTLGDIRGCRIPVAGPLTPRWFIEFIVRNFYQDEQYNFAARLPVHRTRFRSSITERERGLIHVQVPSLMEV
ncbi:MAG: DUF2290 domain-containing protein [Acidiferrobacter thiooxydans]